MIRSIKKFDEKHAGLIKFVESDLIKSFADAWKPLNLILDKMSDRRLIFNVGHGLTPDCKIENVKKVIDIVKNYKR